MKAIMMKQFLQNSLVIIISILSVNTLAAQDLFTNGVIEYNNKNYKEAADKFEQFVNVNPFEVAPYEHLVNCYIELGNNQKAIQLLEESRTRFPKNTNLIKTLGKLYVNDMRFDEAEKVFKEILEIEPNNSEIMGFVGKINQNRAIIHFKNKEFNETISALEKSLKYQSKSEEYFVLKSNSLIQLNKLSEAESALNNGLKEYPNSDQLLVNKSLFLINGEKYNEAIEYLLPVWKRNNDNMQVGLQLARLYRIGNKIKEIFDIYESLIKKYPKEKNIYEEMLDYFSATGKETDKRKIYELMEKEFPDDIEITLAKIKTYVKEEQDSIAIVKYSELIDKNPNYYQAYLELAELLMKNEKYSHGISLMNKALENILEQKQIYFYLGKFYYKNNQLELSQETYERYAKKNPKDF